MKLNFILAACALFCATGSNAAVITKKLEIVSTFSTGTMAKVTSTVEFSFDPNVYNSATLISFKSDGGPAYANAAVKNEYYSGQRCSLSLHRRRHRRSIVS